MKKTVLFWVLVLSVISSGCGKPADVQPEAAGVPVEIKTIVSKDFTENVYFVGELASAREFDIPTGQTGTVQKVLVKPGDRVSEGQSLFIMEHDQFLVELNTQEIQLRNQVALTELQLTEAQKEFDSASTLYGQGAASKNTLDQLRLKLDQARFSAANAKESLKAATSRLRRQIADATVKSPVSGRVASSSIVEGQEVGNITAMKITGSEGMVVNASVPESVISKVKPGQIALISFGEGGAQGTEGRVSLVDSVPGKQPHLYNVEIILSTVDPTLRSGMYAEVSLATATHSQCVCVPKNALRKDEKGPFVVTAVQGKAVHRYVRTGLVNGESVEILEGLKAGETLIVKGHTYLNDGDPIKIIP